MLLKEYSFSFHKNNLLIAQKGFNDKLASYKRRSLNMPNAQKCFHRILRLAFARERRNTTANNSPYSLSFYRLARFP